MSDSIEKYEHDLQVLGDRRASLVSERDQAIADLDAKRNRTSELGAIELSADLGEIDPAEAARRKAEILDAIAEGEAEVERLGRVVAAVGDRIEKTGDRLSDEIKREPTESLRAAQERWRQAQAVADQRRAEVEQAHAAHQEAERRARKVWRESRTSPSMIEALRLSEQQDRASAREALRDALRGDRSRLDGLDRTSIDPEIIAEVRAEYERIRREHAEREAHEREQRLAWQDLKT